MGLNSQVEGDLAFLLKRIFLGHRLLIWPLSHGRDHILIRDVPGIFLTMLNPQKRISIKIISLLLVQVFLATGAVYPEPSDRSIFKGKRPDYKKIQEQRESEIQKKTDILSGKAHASKSSVYDKDISHSVKLSSFKDISSIYIPETTGKVIEVYEAQGADQKARKPLVVHIQDLHTNPEASFNLAGILEILIKDYDLGLVCSEGAEGEVDTSSVAGFPDPEVREKTARLFVESGELTGEEYLSITKYPELPIWGIEDKGLYFENIAEFNKIMEYSADSQFVIDQVKSALEELKPKMYSSELLKIDAKEKEYERAKLGTNEYLNYLLALVGDMDISGFKNIAILKESLDFEKTIDQEKIKNDSQDLLARLQAVLTEKDNKSETETLLAKASLFKDQKISPYSFYGYLDELAQRHLTDELSDFQDVRRFLAYLRKANSLDAVKLFNEIEDLASQIKDSLSENSDQRFLSKALRHIKILDSFFNLRLSNEELTYYLKNKDDFKIGFFERFLKENLPKYNIRTAADYDPALIDGHFSQLERFYEIARKRDNVLFDNAASEIEKRKVKTAALISGGFHTEGITRLLKENGYSYVVITPYSSTEIDEENYKYLLSGKRKPIEELISEVNGKLRAPLANSAESKDSFRDRFDGANGSGGMASNAGILKGRLDASIMEKKAGSFSLDEGVKKIKAMVMENPGKKKLILINGNQMSGKTIFTIRLQRELGAKKIGRVDEDKHQIGYRLRNVSKGQLDNILEELSVSLDSNEIVLYDGINSYKVFRILKEDLLAPYVEEGLEIINVALARDHLTGKQEMAVNYFVEPSFADMTRRIRDYPVLINVSEDDDNNRLKAISDTLQDIKEPVIVMFDIDETLWDLRRQPKIKNLKKLLEVLRGNDNVIAGIVSHGAALVQIPGEINRKDVLKGIRKAKRYIENTEDFTRLGIKRSDFDFIVKGVMIDDPHYKLMTYVRVNKGRWSGDGRTIERIVPITGNWQVGKLVSLAYVDDVFSKGLGLDIFNKASLITIDDDLLQGHSLVNLHPHAANHTETVEKFFSDIKDSKMVQETLTRIKKVTGIVMPQIKGGVALSFVNSGDSKQFDLPANVKNLSFDLLDPLLSQLEQVKSNEGGTLPLAITPLVIDKGPVTLASNKNISRREFLSRGVKRGGGLLLLLGAGRLALELGEPSSREKAEREDLLSPLHKERYVEERAFAAQLRYFRASRATKKSLLSKEDMKIVKGFLTPSRAKAIRFAAGQYGLEPEFLAGVAYEEKLDSDNQNSIKRAVKEYLSELMGMFDFRNTTGMANVRADFIAKDDVLTLLYDNKELLFSMITGEKDRAAFQEFIDLNLVSYSEEYGIRQGYITVNKGLLIGVAGIDAVNILLAAKAIRTAVDGILDSNKDEKAIPDVSKMKQHSDSWVVDKFQKITGPEFEDRYSGIFNSSYYPPYFYHYAAAARYTGVVRSMTGQKRSLGKVKAYLMFLRSAEFKKNQAYAGLAAAGGTLASNNMLEIWRDDTVARQIIDSLPNIGIHGLPRSQLNRALTTDFHGTAYIINRNARKLDVADFREMLDTALRDVVSYAAKQMGRDWGKLSDQELNHLPALLFVKTYSDKMPDLRSKFFARDTVFMFPGSGKRAAAIQITEDEYRDIIKRCGEAVPEWDTLGREKFIFNSMMDSMLGKFLDRFILDRGFIFGLEYLGDAVQKIEEMKKQARFSDTQQALDYAGRHISESEKPVLFLLDSEAGVRGKSTLAKTIMNPGVKVDEKYRYNAGMFNPEEILVIIDQLFAGGFRRIRDGDDTVSRNNDLYLKLLYKDKEHILNNEMSYDMYLGHFFDMHLETLLNRPRKKVILWDEVGSESNFTFAMANRPFINYPVRVVCLTLEKDGARVTSWDWGDIDISGVSLDEKKLLYNGLARDVHEFLKGTAGACKRHAEIIVERLFKERGIKAHVMYNGQYWVETEDGFVIDAFTLGYGQRDLRRLANQLGDEDVVVINKDSRDPLESGIVKRFYSDGVRQDELTRGLWDGTRSAMQETTEFMGLFYPLRASGACL
ncbi:MAG: hypothetical protein WC569_00245 [Candidatus Omnitrophota bacterium]